MKAFQSTITTILLSILMNPGATGQENWIEFNGKNLYLSGANIPWINFARDVGDPANPTDTAGFREIFREIHDNGGNSGRLWIHINSEVTPVFEGNLVTGPGETTIADLRNICDIAYQNDIGLSLCLWSFDMQHLTLDSVILERNKHILTTDEGLASYIDNALIPMVDSLEGHPGILAWEIFNEPEGMTEVGNWGSTQHVAQTDIQKFVNRCAGAIHRTDPMAKVTNGTWSFRAASDVEDGINYYADERLIAQGGDADGFLDFYTVHYYDWDDLSPFLKPYSHWELDKPLIVAEFYTNCEKCGPEDENYRTLYQTGYAGAWAWCYKDAKDGINNELQRTFDVLGDDIMVADPMLPYKPSCIIESPESGAEYKAGADVRIEVYAAKYGGSVAQVAYFDGENKIGEVSQDPFSFLWTSPPDGQYRIHAVSTDDLGLSKISTEVDIMVGDPPVYKYEAEDASLWGETEVQPDAAASCGKYVNMEDNNGGASIEWLIPNCPKDSAYTLTFGYRLAYGTPKNQLLYVNDSLQEEDLGFINDNSADWFELEREVELKEGENRIKVLSGWGWMHFDYLRMPFAKPPVIHVTSVEIVSESGGNTITEKNGSLLLRAVVTPEDADDQSVSWATSDPGIASVGGGWVLAKSDGMVTITATSLDNPEAVGSFDISVSGQSVGLETVDDGPGIRIWPNPFSNGFHMAATTTISELEIYSLTGTKVLEARPGSPEVRVDLAEFADGIYFLHMSDARGERCVRKIVKK